MTRISPPVLAAMSALTLAALNLAACGQHDVNPPTEPAPPLTGPETVAPAEDQAASRPGVGAVSFVGRWSARPEWCAAPQGDRRPIEITPLRFEGYENSCDILAVDEAPGGWNARLRCVSEGATRQERVHMSVAGDVLDLTYLDRGAAEVRLVKCTTLAETPTPQ